MFLCIFLRLRRAANEAVRLARKQSEVMSSQFLSSRARHQDFVLKDACKKLDLEEGHTSTPQHLHLAVARCSQRKQGFSALIHDLGFQIPAHLKSLAGGPTGSRSFSKPFPYGPKERTKRWPPMSSFFKI